MSKLLPAITGVACFLWVSGWTWIISDGKQSATSISNQAQTGVFIDSLRYKVQQPFAFEYSSATPIVTSKLHPALKIVSEKLSSSSKSKLKVIGVYSPSENNETAFPNLGIARAEAIKSVLVSSGANVDQIETVGLESINLFEQNNKLTGVIYFSFSGHDTAEFEAVAVQGEDETEDTELEEFEDARSFYYKYGDYKIEKHHLPYLKELVKTLKNQAKLKVILTGYSGQEEEAESTRINLAEMRSQSVRRYLVVHGVRRAQVEVKAKPSMARSSKEMVVSIQLGQY